jgi:hypothetical protein
LGLCGLRVSGIRGQEWDDGIDEAASFGFPGFGLQRARLKPMPILSSFPGNLRRPVPRHPGRPSEN